MPKQIQVPEWKKELERKKKEGRPKILKKCPEDVTDIRCQDCTDKFCLYCTTDIYDIPCCICKAKAIYRARLSSEPTKDKYFCKVCLERYT